MDPSQVEAALSPRTRAIMPVHQVGLPCDLTAILAIADKHKLPVIEDAACAIGSQLRVGDRWEKIGKPHGTVACFSFHPRKLLTTGDGGMLTTSDPALDRRFRLLRQHGMSISDTARHAADNVLFEEYPILGFNYRMTDIQAAVGRVQLRRLPESLEHRRELADRYAKALVEVPGLDLPIVPEYARTNYQSYPVRVRPDYPLCRDELIQELFRLRVSTRRGIMNAHEERAYADLPRYPLPHSEAARDSVILLPLYGSMTRAEQGYVIECLRSLSQKKEAV
jgi:dTDP-4-amino-4,6-dideoxygalactose transaminase